MYSHFQSKYDCFFFRDNKANVHDYTPIDDDNDYTPIDENTTGTHPIATLRSMSAESSNTR